MREHDFWYSVSEIWHHSVREKYKDLWSLWMRARVIMKLGFLGVSDTESGGGSYLTYATPPEWYFPSPERLAKRCSG